MIYTDNALTYIRYGDDDCQFELYEFKSYTDTHTDAVFLNRKYLQ